MVKNTVRFHESVVDEVESLVEEGVLESKSEFYRFASEYVLTEISPNYEPHMMDFEAVRADIIPDAPQTIESGVEAATDSIPFFESVAVIRKFALRGNFTDAEDFIDHHYDPNEPDGLILEELLDLYRQSARAPGAD